MLKPMFAAALTLLTVAAAVNSPPRAAGDLVAHEWGTFTSVAGEDGRAVAWRPLGGPADLPCFVERADLPPKPSFRTTVRMETPVTYFYAGRPMSVDVSVGFRQGLMTEFFPDAASRTRGLLRLLPGDGMDRLEWKDVRVQPGAREDFPIENASNHYYAARAAHAAPLQVGRQKEGFLFYRGVGGFDLPLQARVNESGEIEIANEGQDAVNAVMLFENRKGRIGYSIRVNVSDRITLPAPDLDSGIPDVRAALVQMLTEEGLYPREAEAMVATWSDSWFEEGTRLFYLVPRRLIDQTLPLDIRPSPAALTRVFVGRLELGTAATLLDLKDALMRNDMARVERHGRFAEPFSQRLLAGQMSAAERARIHSVLSVVAKTLRAAPNPCAARTTTQ